MGNKTQPTAQAGQTSEAAGVAGEVGVPHSSVDLLALEARERAELRQVGQLRWHSRLQCI